MSLKKSKKSNEKAEQKNVQAGDQPMNEKQIKETVEKVKEVGEKIAEEKKDLGDAVKSVNGPIQGTHKISGKDLDNYVYQALKKVDYMIMKSRYFREYIDRIMKIIELSGLQNEIATSITSFNPVEHAMVNLIMAKGSLGELLKNMIPDVDLIAMKCYKNYLEICNDLKEDPTYGDTPFTELPKEYAEGLFSAIEDALKNDVTPESNHEKWMKDKKDAGWVYGEKKDSEKKTHPSLIPYNELPEGERRKGEEFLDIVNAYKNPYSYPKQKGSDVEEVVDQAKVDSLNIKLPEGVYKTSNGVPINHASQLNRVQTVDWIKGMLSDLVKEFIETQFHSFFTGKNSFYRKYDVDSSIIPIVNIQSSYDNLVNAKNIFGYTYQFVK